MIRNVRKRFEKVVADKDEDPLESAKKMINSISQIVGIRNMFDEKNVRKFTVFSIFCSLILGGTFIYVGQFSQLVYLVNVFPDKVYSFQAVNCFISTCVPLSKFIFMYSSRSRLRIITEMGQQGMNAIPNGSSAHQTMREVLRKARVVSWLVIMNQVFTHFVYLFLPFVTTIFGRERYLPTMPGNIYGIAMKYESPYYEITFILTCIATTFSAVNQTAYIVLFVTLLGHELGHFYAICETLNDIRKIVQSDENYICEQERIAESETAGTKQMTIGVDANSRANNKQKKVENSLRFCVKQHQFLSRFHKRVCDFYKTIFGTHFLIMIIVLVTTLQTLNSWGIINTILTGVTGIMPLVVYCFGGELLIIAGTEMCEAVYSCGWESGMEKKHTRVILLMLCLSQHPLCYTAAGIFIMNRETFGNVAQIVYKIYAVFN